eukprot:13778947-Heterocapsa_arctica.AAC.1
MCALGTGRGGLLLPGGEGPTYLSPRATSVLVVLTSRQWLAWRPGPPGCTRHPGAPPRRHGTRLQTSATWR